MKKTIHPAAVTEICSFENLYGIAIITLNGEDFVAQIFSDEITATWSLTPDILAKYVATTRDNQYNLWGLSYPTDDSLSRTSCKILEIIHNRKEGKAVVTKVVETNLDDGDIYITMVDFDLDGMGGDIVIEDIDLPAGFVKMGGTLSSGWALYDGPTSIKVGDVFLCR